MRTISRATYQVAAVVLGGLVGAVAVVTVAHGMSGGDGGRTRSHRPLEPGQVTASCSITVASSHDIRTQQGQIPYVAPWSMAASGERHLLAGGPAFIWARDARAMDLPLDSTGVIGVVVDGKGVATIVGNPIPDRHSLHPRVAPRPEGGWYVLFVASDSADDIRPVPREVTLWLGVYDRQWESLEEIGAAYTHLLRPEQSSELVLRPDGELGFAYGYMHARGSGVVLLRRTRDGWSPDTLHLDRFVHHVELRAVPGGSWTVAYRPNGVPEVAATSFVRLVSYDSAWGEPVAAISDEIAMPDMLRVHALDRSLVALWAVNTGDPAMYGVRWGLVDPPDPGGRGAAESTDRREILEGGAGSLLSPHSFDYVAVPVDPSRLLVVTRGSTPRRGVVIDLLTRRGAERLLELPLDNVVGPAAALAGDGSILLITTTEATEPGMHPVMMTATRLRLRC
jgi:hypothetical protein